VLLNEVMYFEHTISPALQAVAACTWQHTSAVASRSRVVPDACVDIVWDGTRLNVAGPDTRPVEVELRAGTQILGLRFVPGAAGTLLGVPASAVRDARVALYELWGDSARVLQEQLQAADDPRAALSVLEAAVHARMQASAPVDPVADAVARALRPSLDGAAQVPSVAQLSAALGVSERQLLRRCDTAFGYGPKLLARILRFQSFVHALRSHADSGLAELALTLGYTDQAHLAHETAELAGQTPKQLRARWSTP
jgi:AraC-like DNA-binding protein